MITLALPPPAHPDLPFFTPHSHRISSCQSPVVPLLEVEMSVQCPSLFMLGFSLAWGCGGLAHAVQLPCCAEHTVPYSHPPFLALLQWSLSLWVEGCDVLVPFWAERFKVSYSLYLGQLWVLCSSSSTACTQSFSDEGFAMF